MKAIIRTSFERDGFRYGDKAVPEIGENDVLLKVMSVGLCGSDMHALDGHSDSLPIGCTPGHEMAGVIAQVGENVKRWKVGDRVAADSAGYVCGTCQACIQGNYAQCKELQGMGYGLDGGFAQYVRIPGDVLLPYPSVLVPIPDNISFDEACTIDPAANGYYAIVQEAKLMPGQTVAVVGAGPLGLAAIQAAKLVSARKILVLVRKSTKQMHRDAAIQYGATDILETDGDVDLRQFVAQMTDGVGLDLIVDTAGPHSLYELYFDLLKKGGDIVKVGYGFEPHGAPLNNIMFRSQRILGHMGYNPTSWHYVLKLMEAGMIDQQSMITHVLPLSDFFKGVELMRNRDCIKVVFHPNDEE